MTRTNVFLACLGILAAAACSTGTDRPDAGPDAATDVPSIADVPGTDGADDRATDAPDATGDAGADVPADGPATDATGEAIDDAPGDATDDASGDTTPDAPDVADVDAGPMHLVVMTFNVRTFWGNDGVNAWEYRRPLALKEIGEAAPDVLGTQEAVYNQVDDLAAGMPGYDHVGRSRTESPLDETNTIFYRTDRFQRLADDTFQLSDTPDVIESVFSTNQLKTRIVTWVRLRERSTGREFVAFNTHFDTESVDDIQVKSAALTVTKIAQIAGDRPAFLSGDFNSVPGSDPWKVLTGQMTYGGVTGDLVDPWVELGLPEQGTSSGYSDTATRRIDNVFHVPAVHALGATVVHTHEGEVYASDHFQVVVELELWPDGGDGAAGR